MRLDLLGVVLKKEVVDTVRDRRALAMAVLVPLLGPVFLGVMLSVVSRQVRAADERPLPLPVVGAGHAPNLVAWLEEGGAEILPPPADPEGSVRAGDHDVVLVIPPEFGARLLEGQPAPVRLVLDESRQSARAVVERTRRLLAGWSHRTGALRLMARGVSPALPEALAVETVDLATPESRAGVILSMLPYFLVMAAFVGGMSVAIDATAGERERQSLEPLLLNPVPRGAVALAKVAAAALFAALSLAVTTTGFGLLPLAFPLQRLGFAIRLEPWTLLAAFGMFLPLVALASAIQVLLALRARSFKAAQASLSFLMLVPALPGVVLGLIPFKVQAWMMLVPALGEQLLLLRLVRGEAIPAHLPLLSLAATSCYAALACLLAARTFASERAMFGR